MTSRTIVLETQVPEDVYLTLRARGLFREALAEESRHLLALRYYRDRILSLGKAARLAGMSRWAFIDFLSDNDVPVIDLSDEELEAELAAVDELEAELAVDRCLGRHTPHRVVEARSSWSSSRSVWLYPYSSNRL